MDPFKPITISIEPNQIGMLYDSAYCGFYHEQPGRFQLMIGDDFPPKPGTFLFTEHAISGITVYNFFKAQNIDTLLLWDMGQPGYCIWIDVDWGEHMNLSKQLHPDIKSPDINAQMDREDDIRKEFERRIGEKTKLSIANEHIVQAGLDEVIFPNPVMLFIKDKGIFVENGTYFDVLKLYHEWLEENWPQDHLFFEGFHVDESENLDALPCVHIFTGS